jgi:thiosulfate reductase cytochrome b subunit
MTSATPSRKKALPVPSQAVLAKTFHWVNIISLLLMMSSGLQIYNANPVFGGRGGWHVPSLFLLGGWLGGGRDWHFAVMWIYSLNLLAYGLFVFISRRWKRRFASSSDIKAIRVSENVKRKNYAWHRLVYTLIIPILILAIASGLAMYKPVQLHWLAALFGNWQTLRTVHFITVPTVLLFTFIHSLFGLKVGGTRLIKSMFV